MKKMTMILVALMAMNQLKADYPPITNVDAVCTTFLNDGEIYFTSLYETNTLIIWSFEKNTRIDLIINIPEGYEITGTNYVYKNVYSTDGKFAALVTFKNSENNKLVQVINEDSEVLFEQDKTISAYVLLDNLIVYVKVDKQPDHTFVYKLPGKALPYGEHTIPTDPEDPTSINLKHASFNVFPNPAVNEINIQSNNKASTIKVYSIDGKFVDMIEPKYNTETINISEYPEGGYIIKMDGKTLKFIKE